MNLNEEVEILKGVPLFAKMEPARLKLLAFTGERMTFGTGQEVCHQGDPGDAMYVILGGVADVLLDTPNGPLNVAQLKKNGFFGETAILCEAPRIAPHRGAMRTRLAELLAIEISRVGVKATTTEGLGFTGRGEGIAALASAIVILRAPPAE